MKRRIELLAMIAAAGMLIVGIAAAILLPQMRLPLLEGNSFHDFGVVDLPGESAVEVKHRFTLVNRSGRHLEIRAVLATCGCVTAGVSDNSLAPGEATHLDVVLKVMTSGRTSDGIRVMLADGTSHDVWVVASGRRLRYMSVVPGVVNVQNEDGHTLVVTALNYQDDCVPPLPLFELPDRFSVEYGEWKLVQSRDLIAGAPARWEQAVVLRPRTFDRDDMTVLLVRVAGYGDAKVRVYSP
ncbi:MAG: DUF1573 domain-containing protein [Phycisphaeraceae bacterium]|nr:DUF1573 domain-containing protein [Phycisphaerales bacterium]QOJ17348.1 MAG: DUF1573 domain-containing protein [Phycisphaeraceae bacterium]